MMRVLSSVVISATMAMPSLLGAMVIIALTPRTDPLTIMWFPTKEQLVPTVSAAFLCFLGLLGTYLFKHSAERFQFFAKALDNFQSYEEWYKKVINGDADVDSAKFITGR
jgi:hypothetical protein